MEKEDEESRNLKNILGYFWHITDFHLDTNFSSNDNGKLNDQREYFIGDYAYDVCWGKAQGTVYIRTASSYRVSRGKHLCFNLL